MISTQLRNVSTSVHIFSLFLEPYVESTQFENQTTNSRRLGEKFERGMYYRLQSCCMRYVLLVGTKSGDPYFLSPTYHSLLSPYIRFNDTKRRKKRTGRVSYLVDILCTIRTVLCDSDKIMVFCLSFRSDIRFFRR